MTFADLREALLVFGLGERATRSEIKARYRQLVKKYHPDVGDEHDNDRIRMINAAYQVLLAYIESFRFSFAEDEFYEQNPDERLRRQFMNDPLWGNE
ncbi:MAG: J domain-containing protein [Desulfuromonadales bacterium]|nr:J domain-containing protein [Desulfuromonadales bacterium]